MARGFLSEYDEVIRVTFGDDAQWWVDVRRFLSRNDYKVAQAALVSPVMRSEGEEAVTSGAVDTGGYQNELVIRAIVAWNLTDRDGAALQLAPAEARRASVEGLPQKVFETILEKIDGAGGGRKATAAREKAEATFPVAGVEGPVGSAEGEAPVGADLVPG